MIHCPGCDGTAVVKNGHTATGTPSYRCTPCRRTFVLDPAEGPVPAATKDLIRRLLAERVSLRGIARVTGVARSWLQRFVNALYAATPHAPGPVGEEGGR